MSLFHVIANSNVRYRGIFRQRERAWAPPHAVRDALEAKSAPPLLPAEPVATFFAVGSLFSADSLGFMNLAPPPGDEGSEAAALNIVAAYETLMEFGRDDGKQPGAI